MKLKDFDEIIDTMAATPNCDFVQALIIMNNAPTVDPVPAIRCEECYFYYEDGSCEWNGSTGWAPDDYCSHGTPKEDAYDQR